MNTKTHAYKTFFVALFILTVMLFTSTTSVADVNFGPDVEDGPVDGGISLLVAAGAGYGIKRLYDAKKKKSNP